MSNKNSVSKFLGVAILLAVIAIALFLIFGEKRNVPTEEIVAMTSPVVEEVTTEVSEAMPSSETNSMSDSTEDKDVTQGDLVVETKTLPIASISYPVAEDQGSPEVQAMMSDRKLGSDDAPIKVVEYSSLTCGHCAAFHNDDLEKIKTDYIDTGKVQFIFKEYPLNRPAVVGSQILRCMPEDKFAGFMGLLFEQQDKWAYSDEYMQKLTQYAKLAGLGEDEINSCIDNVALEKRIIGDMQAAHEKYQISSTPSFIVNGGEKMIVGHQPYSFFQATFDELLNQSSK